MGVAMTREEFKALPSKSVVFVLYHCEGFLAVLRCHKINGNTVRFWEGFGIQHLDIGEVDFRGGYFFRSPRDALTGLLELSKRPPSDWIDAKIITIDHGGATGCLQVPDSLKRDQNSS